MRFVIVALVLFVVSQFAHAAVTVSPPGTGIAVTQVGQKYRVTIIRTPGFDQEFIVEGNAGDTIEYIRVTNNNPSSQIELEIRVRGAAGTSGILNVEEFTSSGPGLVWLRQFAIKGNCGTSSGGANNVFRAHRVDSLEVEGHFYASLYMDQLANGVSGYLNSINVGGNLYGDIYANQAPIGDIDVTGDIIGPTDGGQGIIRTDSTIDSVRARSMINSSIGQYNFFSYVNYIGLVEITNDVITTSTSSLPAGILAQSIGTIRVGGDYGCWIAAENGLAGAQNTVQIDIGGDLLSEAVLTFPSNGLTSQIVLNSNNDAAGDWEGEVYISGMILTPAPEYTRSPVDAGFGGGAVGLVPFRLHRHASWPADEESVQVEDLPTYPNNPIIMRHYGPVTWDEQGDPPYSIKRRRASDGTGETDETACFTQERDASNHTIVKIIPNEVSATEKPIVRGFEYVIELRTFVNEKEEEENVLRCDLPSGATPPVFDYPPLAFTVCTPIDNPEPEPDPTTDATNAAGDANDDGCVNFADTISVLANFGNTTCGNLGDANRDGIVDFSDVIEVLRLFDLAQYCAECQSEGFAPGGGGMTLSEAIETLGYESIDGFIAAIGAMNQADMTAALNGLGELLESGGSDD